MTELLHYMKIIRSVVSCFFVILYFFIIRICSITMSRIVHSASTVLNDYAAMVTENYTMTQPWTMTTDTVTELTQVKIAQMINRWVIILFPS